MYHYSIIGVKKITIRRMYNMRLPLDQIEVRKDLYPRFEYDKETVNSYRLSIDELPPIVISESHILIDGYHRLIAHRIEQKEDIEVEILPITDEMEILKEAIRRNSTHGKRLSREEKKKWANKLYDDNESVKDIATIMGFFAQRLQKVYSRNYTAMCYCIGTCAN